jgi:transposase
MEERRRRSFTEDYKRQAVELAVSSGRSITSVAKELGLRDSVLRRWVDKFRLEPTSAARRPTTQATPMSADQGCGDRPAGAAVAAGPGCGDRPAAPGERTAAHGARHFKKPSSAVARLRGVETALCYRLRSGG